jgi:EAL domain-containing protein (putative c-di-GMP-specific phosphodiesterase class I)/anti-sigma regulatory factor (Ser/Thr protein kinase)
VWLESTGGVIDTAAGLRLVATHREAARIESLVQDVAPERQLRLQMQELADRQQRFLTTVGQKARTPLTSVMGIAALLCLRGNELDPDPRHALIERLHANAELLMELLEDATEADELTRADVVIQRRVADVHALVRNVVEDLAYVEGSTAVVVDIEPGLRAVLDRVKVARILEILIGNAFTHGGAGVSVRVSARATDEGLELIVDDDGPGIRPETRKLVFEPFAQSNLDATNRGAGLGLYIVSELTAVHRGRVRVEDSPAGGARFRVVLSHPRTAASLPDAWQPPEEQRAVSALRPEFDRFVTQLLGTLRARSGMDLAYLSIFEDRHQHVLAVSGQSGLAGLEPGRRIPLEETYCAQMVKGELDRVVGDTSANPRTAELPVTKDGLASWTGVPVFLPSGQVIGTLCCAQGSPRPERKQSDALELHSFAGIFGDLLAGGGFIDRTVLNATERMDDVLARPGAVFPVFQPIIDLTHGHVAGVEALSRFAGHDRPVELWFADAVRAGLIIDLEILAIRQSLTALEVLPADAYLALNVCPLTAQSRELAALLDGHPMDRIVMEVTEHAAVANYRPLAVALAPYRAEGMRVAIDDVGTGYAGLGHLVQLRPEIIKVDRSLIETVDTDPAHAAAVGAIVGMAKHLGAFLVAEGIERPETLNAVRELGFSHAQGYLLARPAPELDFGAVTGRSQRLLDEGTLVMR